MQALDGLVVPINNDLFCFPGQFLCALDAVGDNLHGERCRFLFGTGPGFQNIAAFLGVAFGCETDQRIRLQLSVLQVDVAVAKTVELLTIPPFSNNNSIVTTKIFF